jgi:hypothetical protein
MTDLRTQVRDIARRRRRTVPTWFVDVAIAATFALIVTGWLMHDPSRAPDVTIVNDTPYDLTIKVSNATGERWMPFALVSAQSQLIVRAPIDQGEVWVFSFGPGGEYSLNRSALRESGWHMHVPASVPTQLAAAGIAPSPQPT